MLHGGLGGAASDAFMDGVDTATDYTTDPIGDQFDDDPGGGVVDILGGNVAAGAETAEGLTFGVFDTAGDWAGAGGSFLGESLLGATETGAEAAGDAGDAAGNFLGGAINSDTLILIGAAVLVAYIVVNSSAGEAAGQSVGR